MKLRLFCGVCLVISQFSYGQIHFSSEDVFPHKKEIYKKGWIDFNKNGIKDVYEDSKQSVESRLDDLLSQMTLEEKAGQLVTYYGYKKVLEDSIPTEEWKRNVLRYGVANIDEHLNGEIYDLKRLVACMHETSVSLWNILV